MRLTLDLSIITTKVHSPQTPFLYETLTVWHSSLYRALNKREVHLIKSDLSGLKFKNFLGESPIGYTHGSTSTSTHIRCILMQYKLLTI